MTTQNITDEELEQAFYDAYWGEKDTSRKFLAVIHTARRLLCPPSPEAVARLVEVSHLVIEALGHDYQVEQRLIKQALKPFVPSPDELRMERGKTCYLAAYNTNTDNSWTREPANQRERWCRVADAVLAKKAEQDAQTEKGDTE